jgi:catechol 2,3-dioxygenase-like lactoylglutathione lyase family enzyme
MHTQPAAEPARWPEHLRPGAVRFTRSSRHYDATVAFYRDLVGLPLIGDFAASFGEDGTIFGFPDDAVQLEIVRAHGAVPEPDPLDLIVLYLDGADAVEGATAVLERAGLRPLRDQHPYWAARGAVTYLDPDGRGVVFAPWVYGRDPEPAEHPASDGGNGVRLG